jgi:2-iminobutanoate/2-iminopropanoate deaminase
MKKAINTKGAPVAIGPYSQGVEAAGFVFVSGQIPLVPETGEVVTGGIEAEARRALENLKGVLEGAGCGLDNVVKTTVYLADMADFSAVNEVYAEFFSEPFPARATVEVKGLPKGVRVEVDATAAAVKKG